MVTDPQPHDAPTHPRRLLVDARASTSVPTIKAWLASQPADNTDVGKRLLLERLNERFADLVWTSGARGLGWTQELLDVASRVFAAA